VTILLARASNHGLIIAPKFNDATSTIIAMVVPPHVDDDRSFVSDGMTTGLLPFGDATGSPPVRTPHATLD